MNKKTAQENILAKISSEEKRDNYTYTQMRKVAVAQERFAKMKAEMKNKDTVKHRNNVKGFTPVVDEDTEPRETYEEVWPEGQKKDGGITNGENNENNV